MSFFDPERRRSARTLALMPARIYRHSARASLDCRIRDISEEGASLRGPDVHEAPDVFRLEIPARHALVTVRVRWRRPDAIGVVFEREPD